jgi:hypothetical protein
MNEQRAWMVGAIVFALVAGCSGSGDGSGGGADLSCPVPNQMSVPGSEEDPCDQTDAACMGLGGQAVNCCMPSGEWQSSCVCKVPGSQLVCGAQGIVDMNSTGAAAGTGAAGTGAAGTGAAVGAPMCGNGVIEGTEQCDGADMNGATCDSLGMGMGTLACSSCTYDTSMCMMGPPAPPTAGSGGGAAGSGS